jgi:hypothetical protein
MLILLADERQYFDVPDTTASSLAVVGALSGA